MTISHNWTTCHDISYLKKEFHLKVIKHITDFQILKTSGVYEVEGMYTIQLLSAAFNTNDK